MRVQQPFFWKNILHAFLNIKRGWPCGAYQFSRNCGSVIGASGYWCRYILTCTHTRTAHTHARPCFWHCAVDKTSKATNMTDIVAQNVSNELLRKAVASSSVGTSAWLYCSWKWILWRDLNWLRISKCVFIIQIQAVGGSVLLLFEGIGWRWWSGATSQDGGLSRLESDNSKVFQSPKGKFQKLGTSNVPQPSQAELIHEAARRAAANEETLTRKYIIYHI